MLEKTFQCPHCGAPITLSFLDFYQIPRPENAYRCAFCAKPSRIPASRWGVVTIVWLVFPFLALDNAERFGEHAELFVWVSWAAILFSVGLIARGSESLEKYVDPMASIEQRPLYQKVLIFVALPVIITAALLYVAIVNLGPGG
jgi:hypothetical protein